MSHFVRNLTVALAMLNAVTGIFIVTLLTVLEIQIPGVQEFRWALIVGMPILLFVSFLWLNQQSAKAKSMIALQSIGQVAIFLAPYWWIMRHAQ